MSEIALPTAVELEEGIKVALSEVQNVTDVTLGQFRERLCQHFELPSQGLDSLQDCIKQMTIDLLQVPDGRTQILENLGPEMPSCIARVYLATISQVLGETIAGGADLRDLTQVSREDIAKCFQDAFDNPIRDGKGGRPLVRASSVVRRLVVVQEKLLQVSLIFMQCCSSTAQEGFWQQKKRSERGTGWQCTFRAATRSFGVL